jgi:hypothetical protein
MRTGTWQLKADDVDEDASSVVCGRTRCTGKKKRPRRKKTKNKKSRGPPFRQLGLGTRTGQYRRTNAGRAVGASRRCYEVRK